ncbi:Uncharacterized protein SCF082_LOCUS43965 [Durusdinium trenchii]|uniref:Uncharacterized protein n=1 Tax=Durusdinium trenchii TaxID=1381693 RepID=A0ABP0QYR1_9DINO
MIGAPRILMQLVVLITNFNGVMPMDLHLCEFFAGCMAVTGVWTRAGYRAAPFEILLDSSWMDILTPQGFCLAICMALRMRREAFAMLATVCSSWVFVSRSSSHGTHVMFQVSASNQKSTSFKEMVAKMTLILYILESRRCYWCYEQPSSSMLWSHPRMQAFFKKVTCFKAFTYMGAYGASTPKPTHLVASRASVWKFCRTLPEKEWGELVTKKTMPDGRVSVTGSSAMKGSQAYTEAFGLATLATWLDESDDPEPDLTGIKIPSVWAPLTKDERWEDAKVHECMQYLSGL